MYKYLDTISAVIKNVNSRTKCKIFGFILTLVNQTKNHKWLAEKLRTTVYFIDTYFSSSPKVEFFKHFL